MSEVAVIDVTDMPVLEDKSGQVEDLGYKELKITFNKWNLKNTWIQNTIPNISSCVK